MGGFEREPAVNLISIRFETATAPDPCFKRLSPVPELYDVLIAHDGPIAATPFADAARQTVDAFVRWKLSLASAPLAVPALYALHVIETSDLTITAHVPLADVECTACR